MRIIKDKLFVFKTELNWFEQQYKDNINTKRNQDITRGKQPKTDSEYFTNGKNLFSILADEYATTVGTKEEFRKKICQLVIVYNNYSVFEQELGKAFNNYLDKIIFCTQIVPNAI